MDIQYFADFVELSRSDSLTDAARRIGVTQSALSKRLRQMEHELGVALIVRDSNGIALTEEGERFRRTAIDITNHYRCLINDFGRAKRRAEVRVGGMFHDDLVRRLLDEVASDEPAFKLVRSHKAFDFAGMPLERGELDVFFAPMVGDACVGGAPVERVLLKCEPAFALLEARHPLVNKTVIEASDLRDCYLVRYIEEQQHASDDGWRAIEAMCAANGFLPKVNFIEARGGASGLRDAVYLLPESAVEHVRQLFPHEDVRALPVASSFSFDLYMSFNTLLDESVRAVFRRAARSVGGAML